MKSSIDSPLPDSIRALFAFFSCACLLILALGYAWDSFQKKSQAATEVVSALSPDSLKQGERALFTRPVPSVASTEAHDAAMARALTHGRRVSSKFLPTSVPGSGFSDAPHLVPVSLPARPLEGEREGRPGLFQNPEIAIIIDDMGLAVKNSHRVVDLPAGLTLSYLPYADNIQEQVNTARSRGHEIMLHIPMEPLDRQLYPGPDALTTAMSLDEVKTKIQKNLAAFSGYVGVNNHMGSRATSTRAIMNIVMNEVDRHNVYFVDSWTSPRSVAYEVAAREGIPRGRRDVFLDHYEGEQAVWSALKQAESLAHRHGSAVVIGHPKNDTINVLRAWLPMAVARGVQIVPMSRLTYAGALERDPVLLADSARRVRGHGVLTQAEKVSRLAPAAGDRLN